jgi:hypothetical protein
MGEAFQSRLAALSRVSVHGRERAAVIAEEYDAARRAEPSSPRFRFPYLRDFLHNPAGLNVQRTQEFSRCVVWNVLGRTAQLPLHLGSSRCSFCSCCSC